MNTISSTARTRLIIPLSGELRDDVLNIAKENKLKIAELGRKLFEDYVKAEKRRRRHEELRRTMIEYYDVVVEVQHEWRHTEVENWPEDE